MSMMSTISASRLGMYLRCGEMFRRRYIEGEIVPPGIALGAGSALHKVNEHYLTTWMDKKESEPLDVLQDVAHDSYIESLENGVYMTREEAPQKSKLLEEGLRTTINNTKIYKDKVAPNLHSATAVERPFEIQLPDDDIYLTAIGYIDATLATSLVGVDAKMDEIVVDLKTSSRKKPANAIETELQPTFYTLARMVETGMESAFAFEVVINNRDRQVIQGRVPVERHRALLRMIRAYQDALEAGTFLPTLPSNWWCSERFCGYHRTCRYVGN